MDKEQKEGLRKRLINYMNTEGMLPLIGMIQHIYNRKDVVDRIELLVDDAIEDDGNIDRRAMQLVMLEIVDKAHDLLMETIEKTTGK